MLLRKRTQTTTTTNKKAEDESGGDFEEHQKPNSPILSQHSPINKIDTLEIVAIQEMSRTEHRIENPSNEDAVKASPTLTTRQLSNPSEVSSPKMIDCSCCGRNSNCIHCDGKGERERYPSGAEKYSIYSGIARRIVASNTSFWVSCAICHCAINQGDFTKHASKTHHLVISCAICHEVFDQKSVVHMVKHLVEYEGKSCSTCVENITGHEREWRIHPSCDVMSNIKFSYYNSSKASRPSALSHSTSTVETPPREDSNSDCILCKKCGCKLKKTIGRLSKHMEVCPRRESNVRDYSTDPEHQVDESIAVHAIDRGRQLDATRDFWQLRETATGQWGSHPSHDGMGDEDKP